MICTFSIVIILTFISSGESKGHVTCRDCKGVDDPLSCIGTTQCENGEVCMTREYINDQGTRGFKLGCESKQVCDIVSKAGQLLGKRDQDSTLCEACCATDECNANLCTRPTSPPHNQIKGDNQSCTPTVYVASVAECRTSGFHWQLGHSCFLVENRLRNWTVANEWCKSLDAELMVFNSKQEYEFIKQNLESHMDPSKYRVFYVGAQYSVDAGAWVWGDCTTSHYEPWCCGGSTPHFDVPHVAVIDQHGMLRYDQPSSLHSFVCERHLQSR